MIRQTTQQEIARISTWNCLIVLTASGANYRHRSRRRKTRKEKERKKAKTKRKAKRRRKRIKTKNKRKSKVKIGMVEVGTIGAEKVVTTPEKDMEKEKDGKARERVRLMEEW